MYVLLGVISGFHNNVVLHNIFWWDVHISDNSGTSAIANIYYNN